MATLATQLLIDCFSLPTQHKDETSQCGLCGESFALPQELSVHVRAKCEQHSGGRHLVTTSATFSFYFCQFYVFPRQFD